METARKPRILVFASGTRTGGGSGFREMVEMSRVNPPVLDADIVGVVSNYENGGVRRHADELGIPFRYWNGPFTAAEYQALVREYDADYVMLSGWLKLCAGLDPRRTFNIHPALLPDFGGVGMHGRHVHEAVMKAYRNGQVTESGFTIHSVNEEYDRGLVVYRFRILIRPDDTPETLGVRVNEKERAFQAQVFNEIVHGRIRISDDGTKVVVSGPLIPIY